MYDQLLVWKKDPDKKCLMIKGARQVGKTYLIREFGKAEYSSFIEINFIRQKEYKQIFDGELSADNIYKRLTAQIKGVRLIPGQTLIFLDEIQNCGNARTAVKFLSEDGRFDVITSGSLLGLTYTEEGDPEAEEPDSVPTGYEDHMTLYPLDFEEFLWAEGYTENNIAVLKEYFLSSAAVPEEINRQYSRLFREYIVCGGMPEVVADYVTHHDFERVSRIQNRILENYRFDIARHAKGAEKTKVRSCYEAIPRQLAKELKKFQYSTVEKGQTSKKYAGSVQWLIDSALVLPCYNVREAHIPLAAGAINEQFKLYFNDSGLLCAVYGFETKKAILNNTLVGSAKGGIYENVIASSLIQKGRSLFYYKPDEANEIEFLLEKDGGVLPLEVKAGNNPTVSLNRFIEKYHPDAAYKLISGNVGISGEKITLPHYMILFI